MLRTWVVCQLLSSTARLAPWARALWAGQQSNCCRGADNASGLKQAPGAGWTSRIGSRSAGGLPPVIWGLGDSFLSAHPHQPLCITAWTSATFFFFFNRAALLAYRSSQARGRIGATAASLHTSPSNMGSKLPLQSTPQLMATPDP